MMAAHSIMGGRQLFMAACKSAPRTRREGVKMGCLGACDTCKDIPSEGTAKVCS